jgi:hypothetical protein
LNEATGVCFHPETASKFPRTQQEKIEAVVEVFVNQHSDREA